MANELTDLDRELLRRLTDEAAPVAALADAVGRDEADVADRVDWMADNGVVVREDDDRVALTDSGWRVLAAPGDGSADERIDSPEAVERLLARRRVRPDRADAVRRVVDHLRHDGAATPDELAASVYPEHPAGYDAPGAWWTECLQPALDALADDGLLSTNDGRWRYDGPVGPQARAVDEGSDDEENDGESADGREVLEGDGDRGQSSR